MKDHFELSVNYKNKDYKFQVARQLWGDGHRYALNVNDIGMLFSPDVYGKINAVLVPGNAKANGDIDQELLSAIAKKLEKLNDVNN